MLRGLREHGKNEREQGIVCRTIKSLIKITSQDSMASRERGEYLNPDGVSAILKECLARLPLPSPGLPGEAEAAVERVPTGI